MKAERHHARCACAAAAPSFALAGTERQYERARPFTIQHLFLDLALDIKRRSVQGVATLDFERMAPDEAWLGLDALGFEVDTVRLDSGKGFVDAEYEYDGNQLNLRVNAKTRRGRVAVAYRATPRRGLYFLAPDKVVKDRPVQVWSQCQDEDARHWFPCHDKPHLKMTTELRVAVPSGFVVLSNGELIEKRTPKQGKKPWVYHFKLDQPHPSYLVTLVAGRFQVLDDRDAQRGEGLAPVPVRYYVPPGRAKDGWRSLAETPRMIELFSRLTGVPYPYSRYSQVVVSDFIFGGMENTTATTMYEHILLDERAAIDITSNDLVAHELAHQWFGDHVTCRDWSHAWLNEGFATFFEHVEREDRLGRDEYDYGIAGDVETYLAEAGGRYERPIVCRDYEQPIDLFDRHLYEKGGLVLHMLRRELGDETFWRGVNRYLLRHAGGIVETSDLQRALEEVSGRSLERFFDQWVYRPGHPQLKVKIVWDDGLLSIQVRQAQKPGATAIFGYEIEVEIGKKDGTTERHRKSTTEATDALVVALAERPAWVAFDPELRVASDVTIEAPADMLQKQLELGTSARTRWMAAEALARRDDPATVLALGRALAKSGDAWMVRAEAARALGKIRGEASFRLLEKHVRDAHPKVRRAVVAALGGFRRPEAGRLVRSLVGKDKSYVVDAEACRALGRTRQPGALEPLLRSLDRKSWADVVRAGALDGLASLREERALPAVIERTRYGIPTRGRRAAISALARLGDSRKVREHLEDLLDDDDPHLRIDVVSALLSVGDARARGALRRRLDHELDGRVTRRIREALRDLGDSLVTERKRLSDDLEALRSELTEMKTRLSRVEARGKKEKSDAKSTKDGDKTRPAPQRKSRRKRP
jgi:aminopeptidase N